MASFNLLFGNLLIFTPPVGRCSALVCGGKILCIYYFEKSALRLRVCVQKTWELFLELIR